MIKVAIVEDSNNEAEKLMKYLARFEKESKEQLHCTRYHDGVTFLEEKNNDFDIVFMDIMLPGINGMEAAERMRKTNTQTILIFVTNMLNYAVKSYEVDALDYIVKPISYERVVFKLQKALRILEANKGRIISVNSQSGILPISSDDIYYVEVRQHKLTYHTKKGEYFELKSLTQVEAMLVDYNFSRCNSCYLVNLKYIVKADSSFISMVNGDELKISQPKRKAFLNDLANYLGQGK